MGFMDSWWFYVVMAIILIALVGVFIYLRKKGEED